jgi:hypothetical protein
MWNPFSALGRRPDWPDRGPVLRIRRSQRSSRSLSACCESSFEIRDQPRECRGLLIGSEVTTPQSFDFETKLAQSFLREVDLPVFKGIFVAAAHKEREVASISLEEIREVEPNALRYVISHKTRSRGQIEQAVVTIHGAMELADFEVRYVIASGPHFPNSRHPLEEREWAAEPLAGPVGEAAQHWSGVPRVRVSICKEPTIEEEDAAYFRSGHRLAPFRALKAASQDLQYDKGRKIKRDERCGLDRQIPPNGFDEISPFSRGIGVVPGLVAGAHADIFDKELGHLHGVGQVRQDSGPSKGPIGKSRQEGNGVSELSLPPQEHLESRALRRNDGARLRVVTNPVASCEPGIGTGSLMQVDRRSTP